MCVTRYCVCGAGVAAIVNRDRRRVLLFVCCRIFNLLFTILCSSSCNVVLYSFTLPLSRNAYFQERWQEPAFIRAAKLFKSKTSYCLPITAIWQELDWKFWKQRMLKERSYLPLSVLQFHYPELLWILFCERTITYIKTLRFRN